MKVDTMLTTGMRGAAAAVRAAEVDGFAGLWAGDGAGIDPMMTFAAAADAQQTATFGTSILVAFGRSPMTVAGQAWEMQAHTGGHFLLGLGTQVQAHIERRYSMPWSRPVERMREYVDALHAIWECWQTGGDLAFTGEFYTHTLMPPLFRAQPIEPGRPKVLLAAVGPRMTQAAGAVGDGVILHNFTTEAFMREVTLPALEKGFAERRRDGEGFDVVFPCLIATGDSDDDMARALRGVRRRIAFYGSTPAYRRVLEVHGWGGLQDELRTLTKEGRWDEMEHAIGDEVVEAFAVVGAPGDVPALVERRFGDVVTRLIFALPYRVDDDVADRVVAGLLRTSN